MNEHFLHKWQLALGQRKKQGLFRELRTTSAPHDFSSNDYLGLARNHELLERVETAFSSLSSTVKLGSTGSRLISGNLPLFEETESLIAQTHLAENALIFNTGYMANLAVFSTLPQKGDTVLYDELSHACIKDGIRLSMAERFPFLHNDLGSLEAKLKRATGQVYVAVESVYSMDGDFAPLKEMSALCEQYKALLIVDEAHSTGVFGNKGAGLVCEWGLQDKIAIRVHTYGKAMGVHGASVVGPRDLKPYLVNFARPFIYTSAMSLHSLVSLREAYLFLAEKEKIWQSQINKVIQFFNEEMTGLENKIPSRSAIQALVFSGNENALAISKKLQSEGFDVRPILSPTVKKGKERLRVCLHTYNTEEEIRQLASVVKDYCSGV